MCPWLICCRAGEAVVRGRRAVVGGPGNDVVGDVAGAGRALAALGLGFGAAARVDVSASLTTAISS